MADNIVPSISTRGWITDTATRLDQLLADIYSSQADQSDLYYGTITSMADIYQKCGSRLDVVAYELKDVLTKYLSAYFKSVSIVASIQPEDPQNSASLMKTNLSISVASDTDDLTLQYMFTTSKSQLVSFIRYAG